MITDNKNERLQNPEVMNNHSPLPLRAEYPSGLVEEYQFLALKELRSPLSAVEQTRLQDLIEQISAIDRDSPSAQVMREECDRLEAELESIRLKAEAILRGKQQ
jgi:hypothetical protein